MIEVLAVGAGDWTNTGQWTQFGGSSGGLLLQYDFCRECEYSLTPS